MRRSRRRRQSAPKGLRLWLMCARSPVMVPGYLTHRAARAWAKALAARGLTVQIRRARTVLGEVRGTITAAPARAAQLRLAA